MKNMIITCLLLCLAAASIQAQVNTNSDVSCDGPFNTTVGGTNHTIKELPPLPPPPPPGVPPFVAPDDRLIFWVHGLGGDATSWTKAANATQAQASDAPDYPARKATSLRLSYTEFNLANAGVDLNNHMMVAGIPIMQHNQIEDPANNFVIAHSQGGIVSRQVDNFYADGIIPEEDQMFGGIVTFASPHQGARINNNKDLIAPFSEEACVAVTAGPLEEWSEQELQSNFLVDWILPDNKITFVRDWVCNVVGNDLVPIVLKDLLSPIGEDYAVGAAPLEAINGGNSVIEPSRKVAFFGTEEAPVSFRALYSLKVKGPNQFATFDADYDRQLVDEAIKIISKCYAKYQYWQEQQFYLSIKLNMDPILIPFYEDELRDYVDLKEAWFTSFYWWVTADKKYRALIGAVDTEPVPKYRCTCEYVSPDGLSSDVLEYYVADPAECQSHEELSGLFYNCTAASEPELLLEVVEKPSDGVVLAESAMNFPGAVHVEEMELSNHMQIRNDSNTKAKLIKLFEGGFDFYFFINPR